MRRHSALALTPVLLTTLFVSLLAPSRASADAGSDAAFVSRTNSARAANGLAAYAVAADLTSIARQQAARMAASGAIYHNPGLGSQVCCWSDVGENVGSGATVDAIHNAFMASPEHRANILSSRYTQIGVGTALGRDGTLYVDEVFRRPMGAAAGAPAPAPAPAPVQVVTHLPARRASRSAMRAPVLVHPTAHELLLFRVRMLWHDKIRRHYERFDPLRSSLDYYGVMRQLTTRR